MPWDETDYDSFDDCIKKVMADKGLSEEEAQKYCGKIHNQITEKNWKFDMDIEKFAEDKDGNLFVAGYASHGDKDLDDEYMDMDSLRKAFKEYMKNPVVKFMHDKAPQWRGAVGKVVDKYTDSNGQTWYTKFDTKPFLVIKVSGVDKLHWLRQMVKDEDVKGLSIGGKGQVDEDGVIHVKSWLETSLVDVPSATGSFVKVLKMACVGSDCPYEKEVDGMEDNKDIAIAALAKNLDDTFIKEDIAKDEETCNKVADTINKVCGTSVVKSRAKARIDKFVGNTNI